MSSKKIKFFIYSILIVSILPTVSCSKYIGGQKKQEQVIELSENQFSCLKDVSPVMKKYAQGVANDAEVVSSLDCIKSATTYFVEKTQGTTFEDYTIEDLRKFFGKYFLKQNNLSQELTFDIMKFKKAFLGGSDRIVKKSELRKLVQLIDVLKVELISIRSNFSILSFQSKEAVGNSEVIDESIKKLNRSLKIIAANSLIIQSDYKFEDAISFVQGVADYFKDSQSDKPMTDSMIWLPLLKDIKIILFGENAFFKSQTDWNLAIDVVTEIWGISLGYKHQMSQFTFSTQNEYDQTFQWMLKFLNLLDHSPRMKEEGEIHFVDIDTLLKRAYQLKILKTNVTVENILHTYQISLIRFFNPNKTKDIRSINSLNREMLRALKFELKSWGQIQTWINSIDNNGLWTRSELVKSFKNYNFNFYTKLYAENTIEADGFKDNREEFLKVLEKERTPFLGKDLKVNVAFQGDAKKELIGWKQVTYFHLIQVFAKFFILGYGENGQLSVTQMRQWYNDFAPLGIDLKAFDPRSTGTPERSFQEANFFTFHGNGNQWMDIFEAHELITILFGAGFGAKAELRQQTLSCEIDKIDIFEKKWINEVCFKKQFEAHFDKIFNNLPNLIKERKAMSQFQKDWFYYYLISSARGSDPKNGLLEDSDLRSLMVIMHYIEILISSYDIDHSGNLSIQEIEMASVRFRDFFKTIKPGLTDDSFVKVFKYLVLKGEKPTDSTMGAILDFADLWLDQLSGDYTSAGRYEISKLFLLLKKDLMKQ